VGGWGAGGAVMASKTMSLPHFSFVCCYVSWALNYITWLATFPI